MALIDQKIDFVGGQVKALMNFMNVLIVTHPSFSALKEHFETAALVGQAVSGAETVSEEFLQGMENVNDGIAKSLKIVGERR